MTPATIHLIDPASVSAALCAQYAAIPVATESDDAMQRALDQREALPEDAP